MTIALIYPKKNKVNNNYELLTLTKNITIAY